MRLLKLISPTLVALAIGGCASVDCPVQNTVETVYHAYKADGRRDTLPDTLSVSVMRKNGTDTIVLNRSVRTSTFRLPISYNNAEDTLVFKFRSASLDSRIVCDTVYIAKNDIPQFESVECHVAFFHTINSVRWTSNRIDSITINKSSVNYDASTEHFHIYFKTRQ